MIKQLKEEYKIVQSKLVENERTVRKNHEQVIIKQAKIKDMEQRIAAKNK